MQFRPFPESFLLISELILLLFALTIKGFFDKQYFSGLHRVRMLRPSSIAAAGAKMANLAPNQVIILAGATSAGKSSAAMSLIQNFLSVSGAPDASISPAAEIVIADSVQIYKLCDIGSNKPSSQDQFAVRHHLVNTVDPSNRDGWSAGDFVSHAREAILDILSRQKTPIVVGGSTMWLQWLVRGVPDAPKATTEVVRQAEELILPFKEQNKWDEALNVLQSYELLRGTKKSEKLAKNDWYRLRRYLEIALDDSSSQRGSLSSNEDGQPSTPVTTPVLPSHLDIRCFFLMEERETLYHTIDARCEDMLHIGLINEVAELLLNRHLFPDTTVAKSIGYRQAIEYLLAANSTTGDRKAFEKFLSDFSTATRNYAKRQYNWYRKDDRFLFLQINRKATTAACDPQTPYLNIAQELLHWCQSPRDGFEDQIKRQISAAASVNKWLLQAKRLPINYLPENKLEARVIHALVSDCKLPVYDPSKEMADKAQATTLWLQQNTGVGAEGVAAGADWSASDIYIRAGEAGDKGKSLRTFASHLFKDNTRRFDRIIEERDRLRKRLETERPDVVEQFQREWEII